MFFFLLFYTDTLVLHDGELNRYLPYYKVYIPR